MYDKHYTYEINYTNKGINDKYVSDCGQSLPNVVDQIQVKVYSLLEIYPDCVIHFITIRAVY